MGFYFAIYLDTHYRPDLVVPSVQFRSTDLSSDMVPRLDTGYVRGSTQNATTSYQNQITLPDPDQRSTGGLPTGAGSYCGLVVEEFRICYRGGIVNLDILIQIL